MATDQASTEEYTFQLGDRVHFQNPLVRNFRRVDREKYGRKVSIDLKVWEPNPFAARREGIVVGVRTLSNGERVYIGYEEGLTFAPEEHFTAYLVAFDMRRKPVHVRPEDLALRDDFTQEQLT